MKTSRRRGMGTVIASAVFIFLLIFTVSQLYVYNLNELDDYNQVAAKAFSTTAQKLNEHLTIQSVTVDTSGASSQDILATLVVSNSGGVNSQIQDVWFDDADASTNLHTVVQESNLYVGRGLTVTLSNLDTGIGKAVNDKIKVSIITALGNSVSVELLPPGQAGTTSQTLATISLIVNPPNPITTNDITIVLTVTNINTLGVAFVNLSPDICLVQGTQTFSTLALINNCQALTGVDSSLVLCATLSYPVTCQSISGPTPTTVSYLPYGSTAVFQWIFLVNTITADQVVTVLVSYEKLSTTSFYISASQPQAAYQAVTVRSAGGASGSSGGNFLNAFGSLVNYFNSFQASQSSGVWVAGTALSAGSNTVFRMNITNLSPNVVQFNSNSEILILDSKTGKIYDFYIVQGCTNYQPYYASNTSCAPTAYPDNGYIIGPSQTITMYFTATTKGGTTEQGLGTSGESGQSWTATVAFFGSKFNGQGVTLNSGSTSASISLSSTFTNGMPTTPTTFTLVVQTGWNSGMLTLSGGSGGLCTGTGTPTLGVTVITGLSSANCGQSLTIGFATAVPSCTFTGSPPSCGSGATQVFSNQYNTFAWGVYNTNTALSTGGSVAYGQSSTVFAVRT